jgi:hypothetical protein
MSFSNSFLASFLDFEFGRLAWAFYFICTMFNAGLASLVGLFGLFFGNII